MSAQPVESRNFVSIPMNCKKFHRTKNKQLILDEVRCFDADRVMLNFEDDLDGHFLLYNHEEYQRQLDYSDSEHIAY